MVRRAWFGDELAETWERVFRRDNLRYRILDELLRLFSAEQGLTVTAGDLKAYLDYQDWQWQFRFDRLVRQQAEFTVQAQTPGLGEAQRARLLARLEHLNAILARFNRLQEKKRDDAAASGRREALARASIMRWKALKALYERYGGEVVCGAREIIPVGALEALLQERLDTFTVVLLDPEDLGLFEDYRFPVRGPHFPVSRRQAEAYFSQPWWVAAQKNDPAIDPSSWNSAPTD